MTRRREYSRGISRRAKQRSIENKVELLCTVAWPIQGDRIDDVMSDASSRKAVHRRRKAIQPVKYRRTETDDTMPLKDTVAKVSQCTEVK